MSVIYYSVHLRFSMPRFSDIPVSQQRLGVIGNYDVIVDTSRRFSIAGRPRLRFVAKRKTADVLGYEGLDSLSAAEDGE
jgi:hypothetical protein